MPMLCSAKQQCYGSSPSGHVPGYTPAGHFTGYHHAAQPFHNTTALHWPTLQDSRRVCLPWNSSWQQHRQLSHSSRPQCRSRQSSWQQHRQLLRSSRPQCSSKRSSWQQHRQLWHSCSPSKRLCCPSWLLPQVSPVALGSRQIELCHRSVAWILHETCRWVVGSKADKFSTECCRNGRTQLCRCNYCNA